jgi:putative hydroxymethylpyrimidine transport system substrate-binding protein
MLVAEGLPLVRVGVLVAQPLNSLVALEDSPVKTLADFKGRKIGYSIAGFDEALLGAMLESAGLSLKDVTLINVNFALTTALMSKQVDGVIGAFRNFELNDLELNKVKGRIWLVEKNGVPTYDELILVAKRETVDVAKTKKLLAAIAEATVWLKANPAEAWGIFSKSGKELDSDLNKLAWKDTLPLLADNPTALDRARYETFAAFLVKRGLIKQAPAADTYLRDMK